MLQSGKMDGWEGCVPEEVLDRVADAVEAEIAAGKEVYPSLDKLYYAMEGLRPEDVRVVIIGQDPYHGGQAHGLSFSVQEGYPIPPSLRNIFKVLRQSGYEVDGANGDLTPWKRQGVLLLNRSLTVRAREAGSHASIWTEFAEAFIPWLAKKTAAAGGVVAILWGSHAQAYSTAFTTRRPNSIITTSHPSPLSAHRGFLTSDCFRACNAKLRALGREEIDWSLP